MNTALIIIDAQYDFCDPAGALYVPGAEHDISRLTAFIQRSLDEINHIIVTLDTHKIFDIAHPGFWKDEKGNQPNPFTTITAEAVSLGEWIPVKSNEYVLKYLRSLESSGEFQHHVWPEHCLIGSKGAALDPALMQAIHSWSHRHGRNYGFVAKGIHSLTEHFGIFRAQVPVSGSKDTALNTALLEELRQYDQILIAGEARSHCVAMSVRQIMDFAPDLMPRLVLLMDCMSDVSGMGHLGTPIFGRAKEAGSKFVQSTDFNF